MKRIMYVLLTTLLIGFASGCTPIDTPQNQAGTVISDTLNGVPCCIYLPFRYIERVQKTEVIFPVLYLHHGMYGNENDWPMQGRLVYYMDSLLQANVVKEMVVIMPDNCPHRPTSEEERANAMSGEWERQFPQLMAEAEAAYRISREPSQRAIAGLSMGGFHTLHVSHHLPGQFACVGLFSAAIRPTDDNDIYGQWEDEVRRQMQTTQLYWIAIGKEDFLYDYNAQYRRWLDDNQLEYTYYESEGGHTWDNWQDYLCRFLPELFQ